MSEFPSRANQFKPGQSGNPGGKTAAQRQAEVEASEISAQLRLAMLRALAEKIGDGANADQILERLDPATLKLFKDSEDRAFGTPDQSIKHFGNGEDGALVVQVIKGLGQ